jgi:hypothetical protein
MKIRRLLRLALMAGAMAAPSQAFAELPAPGSAEFKELVRLIKPLPGESKWAEIPWETSLPRARERAVRAGKPLFVWRAGGGDVLGRA